MTPSGLEHTLGVRTTVFTWDQGSSAQHLCHSVSVDIGTATQKCFPVDIPTEATDRAPRGESPTPMAYLAIEARSAVALMAMYAARPHLRAHLGTSRSLDWSPTPPSAVDEATAGLQPWV